MEFNMDLTLVIPSLGSYQENSQSPAIPPEPLWNQEVTNSSSSAVKWESPQTKIRQRTFH